MHDLSAMAVFAAIAEAGSLTQAAERLSLSKSAVSKQLSRLEERLGARLVNRNTRQVSLTEVGIVYFDFCARILEEAEAAEAAVANLQDAPRGRLRVNAPMSFGTMHLAAALTGFANAYPEITVDLELTDAFVDLVDGGIDVAVRITSMQDSTLIARQLAPACRMVAASPDYLAEHGTPQHPRDLSRHNCMIYSLAPNPGTWVFREADGSAMPIPVQGSIRSNNGEVLREAAIAGLGILVDPTFITYRAIRDGRLVPLLCDYELPRSGIHAVYPNRRHLSPKVRAFIDFLGNHFGDPPYWDRHIQTVLDR
ncbi:MULTISPECIES: LysR family transcriptional regulator [unclassified Minwuia]|jgi:DNA-binding transcriptional LysR family regulator|uniref:LysR family transcriptional regulator n=1 Tax=unclassified Minwuia TaxID=2618799 RepID=UPI0024797F22|nr:MULTISPECIES: LysR family transcriptional regulator [unclassified Minwuia]